jgi:NAD(P)-dependent dehydrogenase (short-subunit alcohol dehydrogenase family)
MKDLRGKVVLITGAARGMGKLHAANFAREGSVVVLTDVDEAELDKTVEGLKSQGYQAHAYKLDVSDRDACFALAEKVKSEVGPIDVLVNNAGITECVPVLDQSESALRRMTDVNYLSQVWMMQAVVPDMVRRRSGHVVNVASIAGKVGTAMMGGYCATKHAVIGITDAIRQELRGSGVQFTLIEPGYVSTGMFEGGNIPFITSWQDPQKVSDALISGVKKNKGEVCVPWFNVRQVAFARGLCVPRFVDAVFHIFGVDKSMDDWRKDECRPF